MAVSARGNVSILILFKGCTEISALTTTTDVLDSDNSGIQLDLW